MQTYILTAALLLIYALVAVCGMRKRTSTSEDAYFSVDDTNVLKGLWCIIILLVHIPAAYQNKIQDMVGSFAYIGVTFFFMASAYGLKYGINHKEDYLHNFWKKRLPKLLIPAILVNILSVVNSTLLIGNEFHALSLININRWVLVLLLFYIVFWFANTVKFGSNIKSVKVLPDCIVCGVVIAYSLIVYFAKDKLGTQWPTECFGFIYGILLARIIEKYKGFGENKWLIKMAVITLVSLLFGVAYLKFKPIEFWGDYLLKIVLGLVFTLMILQFIIKYKIGNKASRFLGSVSYEVYLLHGVVFSFLGSIFPELSSGLFICIAVVITLIVSVIVKYISDFLVDCFNKILKSK